MFFVASYRRPGDLCASAQIFNSHEKAFNWLNVNASKGDYTHIENCNSEEQAKSEIEYQTQTSVGR